MMELADETIILIGFSSSERRRLYQALRAVTGIGRRSALLALDCGEVIDTLRAVAGQDNSYFRGVPGLGASRITKIFAELEQRYKDALPEALPLPVLWWVEARDALLHLGLDLTQAERLLRAAIASASTAPHSAEELLALASKLSTSKPE
jgi:Holliday junction resolvasome RuvABC DNA-binding subunit